MRLASPSRFLAGVLLFLTVSGPVSARPPGEEAVGIPLPDKEVQGSFVLDGSFVHNIAELQLNVTNWGLIGSLPDARASFSDAPSAMWPAGSGIDFLYGAGLWVGAIVDGQPLVSTGYPNSELLPSNRPEDTLYEMREGEAHGRRYPNGDGDDDGDGRKDEDPKDGVDNDQDGLIDEDYAAIGDQHFRCVMRDDTALSIAQDPDHDPIGIEVVQESYQWTSNELEDVVVLSFLITNRSSKAISEPKVGFYVDADVGPREGLDSPNQDDMVGFLGRNLESGEIRVVPTPDHGNGWFNMAYMYDCDGDDGLSEGYIGVMFLNIDFGPSLEGAEILGTTYIGNYRWFAGTSSYDEGGDPSNDEERYDALSGREIQEVPGEGDSCGAANDYRFLVSTSLPGLPRNVPIRVQMAIVMGETLNDLQVNAAEAMVAYWGEWFDRDQDPATGIRGRESYACIDDYGDIPDFLNPLLLRTQDCPDPDRSSQRLITRYWLDDYGCIWVNDDCGFEILRGPGLDCWSRGLSSQGYHGCTGIFGREYSVQWFVGSRPPTPPTLRVWETHGRVHLFWDNLSELSLDTEFGMPHFEGYRIWRAAGWDRPSGTSAETGPATDLWSAIGEYDVVDSFELVRTLPAGEEYVESRPLGDNTGLDAVSYVPSVLRPDSYEASRFRDLRVLVDQILSEQPWIDADTPIRYQGVLGELTPLGEVYPELEDWSCCYAQIDTLQASHFGKSWYEFVDRDLHDGFHYFHGVSATSKQLVRRDDRVVVAGLGQEGVPQSNFVPTMPASYAQSREGRAVDGPQIYVVPNPATHESLDDFSALHPNSRDSTGWRVEFRNLPQARNLVRVFTLSGDLVAELEHDGSQGNGSVSWNLVSRNGQQVVSGIYLYSVESMDSAFRTFVGRLTLVL